MTGEALRKFLFFLIRSKVLFPGFLLLIAWIITLFTFYIYQPHESVEGLAIRKFSNLQPSPAVTQKSIDIVYKSSYARTNAMPQ